jgi:hypothetical protein
MERKRKLITISFKTEEDLTEAKRKSKQRGRGLSAQIQKHFKDLPDLDK